jgi:hypothetical protein
MSEQCSDTMHIWSTHIFHKIRTFRSLKLSVASDHGRSFINWTTGKSAFKKSWEGRRMTRHDLHTAGLTKSHNLRCQQRQYLRLKVITSVKKLLPWAEMHLAATIGWQQSTKLHGFVNHKTTIHKKSRLWHYGLSVPMRGARGSERRPGSLLVLSFSLVSLCVDCAN